MMNTSKHIKTGVITIVFVIAAGIAAPAATITSDEGSLFNPNDGTSLGVLDLDSGSLTFDTDALTVSGAVEGDGEEAQSENHGTGNGVEMAVFTFDSVDLSGVSINVTGKRGLVLASKSDMTIDSDVTFDDLNGSNGGNKYGNGSASGGPGGPGAEGGTRLNYGSEDPPSGNCGRGGNGYDVGNPRSGSGYGGGEMGADKSGGSGGGYGGAGGAGGGNQGQVGQAYPSGDDTVTTLYGGSGGAGGRYRHPSGPYNAEGGGGGGGGALQLIAVKNLEFKGTINVNGGKGGNANASGSARDGGGGGGSGGGVILAATTLDFSGVVNAEGGQGGDAMHSGYPDGGGGGGGRIAWYCNTLKLAGTAYESGDDLSGYYNVAGGSAGGGGASAGSDGTFWLSVDNGVGFPYAPPTGTLISIR